MFIVRDDINDDRCLGTLCEDDGTVVAQTCEDGNNSGNARIPPGIYTVYLRYSPKHGYAVPGLAKVPGFNNIEIHAGNSVVDTEGCILVGASRGDVECLDGITREGVRTSRDTFKALMQRWGWGTFKTLRDWDDVKAFNDANPDIATWQLEVRE